jgi:cell wall-associated NlpC family hydrolase
MTHDRHIRCSLVLTLVASAAFAAYAGSARPPHPIPAYDYSTLTFVGSTTHARAASHPGLSAPRALEPFVLSQELRDSIVSVALAQLGTPYVFGGTTPRGFDCSGLVRYALAQVHMSIPRTALQQSEIGAPIGRDELQRGDLLAFGDVKGVTHIGLYVGDGRFVHASSVAGRVIVSSVDRRPSRLILPIRGARRLLATSMVSAKTG